MSAGERTSTRDSRASVLEAVRRGRPMPLPDVSMDVPEAGERNHAEHLARFSRALEAASGSVRTVGGGGVAAALESIHPGAGIVAAPDGEWDLSPLGDHDPAAVDVLVCRGRIAVAENGAVWLPESAMGVRAAPYLAQHLVLVIERGRIVADMHAAYAHVDVSAEGFGAFIAGPSKTADIEQSLVIGAHGPRSLTVLVEGSAD